jgi:hypothetical protein
VTVTALGSLSVGAAIPGAAAAVSAGMSGINLALPDMTARLAMLQAFSPQPVSLVAQLALAQGTLGSVQAALSLGLPVPDISAQIAMVAALVAELLASVVQINAQLSALVALQSVLAVGGVAAYAYDGTIGALGGELGAAVGVGAGHANALALVTTEPATWSALSAVLKVSA